MSPDISKPVRGGTRPSWDLPEIRDIQIRRVSFRPPERRNFESSLARYKEAVEFLVSTDGPVPARALGPALFVGDVKVIESQKVGENLYRFLVFDSSRLRSGAPISWGWISDQKGERRVTRFRYELNQ
ncbi:hypothetical protein ACSAZL_05965 [Methanosarcina sp. T3]|uniref:hypothetical protein n=1 Tax=Methanosarcina sp. T3 TaxID=3439062 RepID=UPI003F8519D5